MSLKDDLEAAKKPNKSKLDIWIDTLTDTDREALMLAAVDPRLSNQALVRAMTNNGYSANKDTVAAWRRAHGYVPR